jgi:hypothetical protein
LSMTCGPFAIISYIKDWKTLTLSHSHPPPPLSLSLRLSDLDLSRVPGSLRCGTAPSSARASWARGAAGQASTSHGPEPSHRRSYAGSVAMLVCPARRAATAPCTGQGARHFRVWAAVAPYPDKLSRRQASCARLLPLPTRPGITLRVPDRCYLHRRATAARSSLTTKVNSLANGSPYGYCDNPPRKIPYYRLKPIHFGH